MVTDRTVPLSGTPLLSAMNAIGPARYVIKIARTERATLQVQTRACDASDAAAQQLPDGMRVSLRHATVETCEGDDHAACGARTTIDDGWIFCKHMKIFHMRSHDLHNAHQQ